MTFGRLYKKRTVIIKYFCNPWDLRFNHKKHTGHKKLRIIQGGINEHQK